MPGRYDYVAADITAAYNSTLWSEPGSSPKVSLVTRQFLYLRPEEAFVVYDRVETTGAGYLPKFLLHSLAKPSSTAERLLAGNSAEDGILETLDRRLVTAHGRGVLTQVVLLPEDARTVKIGGPSFNCYVEEDSDPGDGFDGVNLEGGDPFAARNSAQLGLWRTEVEPTRPGTSTRFLHVLLPRLAADRRPLPAVERVEAGPQAHAVRVDQTTVVFARQPGAAGPFTVRASAPGRLLVMDAQPRPLEAPIKAGTNTIRPGRRP
jgi:hypothetical protein